MAYNQEQWLWSSRERFAANAPTRILRVLAMSIATLTPAPIPPPPVGPAPRPVRSIVINGHFHLPINLTDQDAFRTWARSDECPELGRFAFLDGVLWVDLSMEQFYTHGGVKTELTRVLGNLIRDAALGLYRSDAMLLSHPGVGLSTVPDGLFVSYTSLQSGRVQRIPNARNVGAIELVGAPEMVLEVVSDSSVEKDTLTLPPLYHAAGIDEFWRIDARGEPVFEIFRWRSPGYEAMLLPDGWWRSELFGRDFQLVQTSDPLGDPLYTLHVRS
jgi:Uma2 family endonuclease